MKKVIIFTIILAMCVSLCSCGNSAADDELSALKADVDELSNEISELESENSALKNKKSELAETIKTLEAELNEYKEAEEEAKKDQEIQVGDVTVILTDKGQLPQDTSAWRFSDYVTFIFEITNNTDKDIQGVQGVATFNDLFGVKIISINCDFTGTTIPAGGSITVDDLTFEVNQFMSDHTKLYTTDYKDIKFEYKTTSIVFTDGTSKS